MLTNRENVLIACLKETQTLVAQILNDPENPNWLRIAKMQFDTNNMIMKKIKKESG